MRPRINSFGRITRKELDQYFTENQVYGFTVKVEKDLLTYSYHILFRDTKKDPEMLFIKISPASKFVLGAYTNKGKIFNNIEELKKYTKR